MNASNPLVALHDLGQSFWWDQLSRREIQDGSVERMRDDNGMRGITSNPAIFQKSLTDGDVYDADAKKLFGQGLDREAVFWRLGVDDIQRACDILRPVYDASHGEDGFVSLEVDPRLAHDTDTTLSEAKRLWEEVERPNLMIKIPGTPEGVPAIREALIAGINVNVTLLFAPKAHIDVMNAYVEAIEARHRDGKSIDDVASVASFFVSRVDALVDSKLPDDSPLRSKAGVANARVAYANFLEVFGGDRWKTLAAAGARVQRPLWASTSTKDPSLPDTLYVAELIGRDTVNTMPTNTAEAWLDHGEPRADAVQEDVDGARAVFEGLASAGVDFDAVTDQLLREGVEKFESAFDALLKAVDEAR